jgi:hypothetical protein
MKYRVNEMFWSIPGEGANVGPGRERHDDPDRPVRVGVGLRECAGLRGSRRQ